MQEPQGAKCWPQQSQERIKTLEPIQINRTVSISLRGWQWGGEIAAILPILFLRTFLIENLKI